MWDSLKINKWLAVGRLWSFYSTLVLHQSRSLIKNIFTLYLVSKRIHLLTAPLKSPTQNSKSYFMLILWQIYICEICVGIVMRLAHLVEGCLNALALWFMVEAPRLIEAKICWNFFCHNRTGNGEFIALTLGNCLDVWG